MNNVVAMRIESNLLEMIDKLGEEENLDRSSVIRKLIRRGYKEEIKENVAKMYIEGKTTISYAAHIAGISIWEMEKYLIDKGYRSDYSIEDIEREMKLLRRKK